MEFKAVLPTDGSATIFVLIESDWNLKYVWTIEIDLHSTVLIESDWNLKEIALTIAEMSQEVLIESDWNLKANVSIASEQLNEY